MHRCSLALCLGSGLWLAACDPSDPCGPNMTHVQGACIPKTAAPTPAADGGDAAMPATDAGSSTDSGCGEPLDAGLGASCTKDSQCTCAAPYCAIMPGQATGTCTISGCTTKPDNCPKGYSCFDLSAFGVKNVAPFCTAS